MNEAQFLLNTEQVRRAVDEIVVPGMAEQQLPALTSLLMAIANGDPAERQDIAETAVRHAYTHTEDFVESFTKYSGWSDGPVSDQIPIVHETVS